MWENDIEQHEWQSNNERILKTKFDRRKSKIIKHDGTLHCSFWEYERKWKNMKQKNRCSDGWCVSHSNSALACRFSSSNTSISVDIIRPHMFRRRTSFKLFFRRMGHWSFGLSMQTRLTPDARSKIDRVRAETDVHQRAMVRWVLPRSDFLIRNREINSAEVPRVCRRYILQSCEDLATTMCQQSKSSKPNSEAIFALVPVLIYVELIAFQQGFATLTSRNRPFHPQQFAQVHVTRQTQTSGSEVRGQSLWKRTNLGTSLSQHWTGHNETGQNWNGPTEIGWTTLSCDCESFWGTLLSMRCRRGSHGASSPSDEVEHDHFGLRLLRELWRQLNRCCLRQVERAKVEVEQSQAVAWRHCASCSNPTRSPSPKIWENDEHFEHHTQFVWKGELPSTWQVLEGVELAPGRERRRSYIWGRELWGRKTRSLSCFQMSQCSMLTRRCPARM